MYRLFKNYKILSLVLVGILIFSIAYVFQFGNSQDKEDFTSIRSIKAELIPEKNTQTSYGLNLSYDLLPKFFDWAEEKVPQVKNDKRYYQSLHGLVAPCCDDNTVYRCCCEKGGKSCNIIRSAKGLAAHLIMDLDYDIERIQESVLQWLRFARSDYYLAAELKDRGLNPGDYDLTTEGSCYRGLCTAPISEGGCGGMVEI